MTYRFLQGTRVRATLAVALLAAGLACGDGPTDPKPVPVHSLTIAGAPADPTLVGGSMQLVAIPRDAKGAALADREVTWRSSDAAVAEVSDDGFVRTLAVGRATITAESEDVEGVAQLDVRVGATMDGEGGTIALLGGAVGISLPPGALARATVITTAATASPLPDPRLVLGTAHEVGPEGLALAVPAAITLRYDPARLPVGVGESGLQLYVLRDGAWTLVQGSTGNAATNTATGLVTRLGTFAVLATPVARLTITPPSGGQAYVGQSAQFVATLFDAADQVIVGRPVTWSSSDPTRLQSLGLGWFRGLAEGTVTVTATAEGRSASTTVTVVPVPVATIELTPSRSAMLVNQSVTLQPTLRDAQGGVLPSRTLQWATSDASRATVDAQGRVTARGAGDVTITATVDGKSGTSTITVLPPVVADWSRAAEWVTHQGNPRHTGYVAARVDPAVFQEKWVATVSSGALHPVTAGSGSVFVSTSAYFGAQRLTVLDAATGVARWSRNFGEIHGVHHPAFGNGRVWVTTSGHGDSFLWGFNPANGEVLVRSAYGNQWSTYFAPVVDGSTVYMAGGYYGGMYGFDANDGAQRWFFQTNQYDLWTPAVADGMVYAYTGSYSPKLSVVNATTGAQAYEIADPAFSWTGWSMGIAPVLGGQNDVLATQAGRLVSFDLQARAIRWQRTGGYTGTVAVADGVIYVVANGQVEARRESDGGLLWIWVSPQGQVTGNLVVTDNLLFASTQNATYAIDLGARMQVWSYPAGGHLSLSSQGLLLVAQANGRVAAITAR